MITGPEMAPYNIIRGLSLFLTSSLFLIFIFADFTRYFGVLDYLIPIFLVIFPRTQWNSYRP